MTALIRLCNAQRALAEAKTFDDLRNVRDQAVAVVEYCKAAKLGIPLVNDAVEIKLRAERKAGGLLTKMEKHNGNPRLHNATRLTELGIEKTQSHRWQRIASLPDKVFEQYITNGKASDKKEMTTKGALQLAAQLPVKSNGHATHGSGKKTETLDSVGAERFGTIYADPPWQYGNQRTRAATDNHYETLTVDQLCAMPVASLAAESCHLHLWTTNGFLPDAFRVIAAWGFDYKSCFVWVKPQMGIGNYWRVSHEFLLFGVKGTLRFRDKSLKSWGQFKRGKHSAKPEEVRGFIERSSPGPYLELFGRRSRDGWTVFGNQVEQGLFG
jgi:N6-adenosine-specific RNA methylase IME4